MEEKKAEAKPTPKILDDLIKLRESIGGLKSKKTEYITYPVKSAKDLMDKLRKGADDLGMICAGAVVKQEVVQLQGIEFYRAKLGKNVPGLGCHCISTVRFMSSDGSFFDFVGSGHGTSEDDKAGGKASTYAWKDAVVKALSLPDAEMVDTDDNSETIAKPIKKFSFGGKKS